MADDEDDDTPPAKSSRRGPKKRFGVRDSSDDDDDDRPRKKRSTADDQAEDDADEDDAPRKKRKSNPEDEDDDKPRKNRRAGGDRQVKGNEGTPLVMLLAFIGSAVALMGICVGCGWLSFAWAFPDSGGGGGGGWGGGGNEFEVVSVSRADEGIGFNRRTAVHWKVKASQKPSNEFYVVMVRSGGQTVEEPITVTDKGGERAGSTRFPANSGPADVWVERRQSPFGSGKKVSTTQTR